ncbi:hypothetical protein PInf_017825 [Phytophthora infestans]|nr:hypothetical protein PInf_017825 [Phytophthora infestans]
MLQVLTPFVAEIAKGVVEDDAEWMADAGVAVAYAATISLGAILPRRARMEFHLAATKIAPHLQKEHPIFTFDCSATLFDVGLRFQDHRAVLFLWRTSLLESGKPTTRRSSFAYQSEFPRRTSAVLKARGRIVTSQDTEDSDGDDEIVGDTSAITSPLSRAIESGMTGKLKGAHCPGVGKRSLVLLLENVNLDTQGSSMQVNGPCSAMIRQVLDGKGSFIKSTKEYVEFRDLAHVKSIVLDAGLKATQTVLYVEYEDLDAEEVALLVYLIRQDDLPSHVYSSADKVKLHALGHQPKGRPTCPPANRASFLRGVTSEKEKLNVGSKKSAQSPAHLQTIFRENVRRSLYVVLSVGCKRKLLEFMTQQPCVYYRFVSKTFPPWQDASAKEICNNALEEWEQLREESEISISNLRDMVLTIHQTAENFKDDGFDQRLPSMASRARRFGAVATRLDEMLRVFKILFAFHYKKLDKQRQDLRKVLSFLTKRLTQTNVRVAKEETSEIAQSDASQAVVDFAAQLSAQESVEKEARRLFLLDEERCAKIQGEIEMKRASIQRELSKTLPDVQEATEALSQINKYHIVEMKSFTNPPQLVRLAMQAVCVLLDVPPTWSEALRILADIRFLDRLRNFDKDRIDPSLMDRVRFYVNHPDFSMENMRRASLASTTLCKWVLALVRYFEAMKRVAPTQQLLEEIEQSYHVVVQRAEAEKRKLVDIEIHLSELRVLHAVKTQREAELQRTQETRQRFKSSVTSFGQVISDGTMSQKNDWNLLKSGEKICYWIACL